VAFTEDGGRDLEGLTDDRLGRAAALEDEGPNVDDGNASDALAAFAGLVGGLLRGAGDGVDLA
jgi:hypothetical protein